MWDLPKLYVATCSNSAVGATSSNHYIYFVSSLQELKECIYAVKRIDEAASKANNDSSKKRVWLTIKGGGEEKQSEEEMPRPNNNTLDGYVILLE